MNKEKIIGKLTEIFDLELSGVIRYTHYSLMIFGHNRLPLVDFFKAQAVESLDHANLAGEHITGLGGHPPLNLNTIKEKGGTEFKFQNHKCAAEQGKLVMWPAGWTHFHKSEIAPKEVKYIITGWVMYKETGVSIGIEQGSMNEPPPFIQLG